MAEGAGEVEGLTFWGHIGVLRFHILIGGSVFLGIAVGAFIFGDDILTGYLLAPLDGQPLVFLSPLGPLLFKIRIAFSGAFVISFPIWLLLGLQFAGDALPRSKRMVSIGFVAIAGLLGAGSLVITRLYFVPASLLAISHFVVPGTSLMVTADSYLNFFLLCAAVAFMVLELPVVIVALSYLRFVNPYVLARQRRMLFVGLLILMAVLTPTADAITLLIVMVPTVVLVEVGIAIAKLVYNGNKLQEPIT